MQKMGIRVLVLSALAATLTGSYTLAGVLGVAGDFNAFIFQNMHQGSDSEGALAVGGNLNAVGGYSIATALGTSGTHLVVGGNFSMTGGSIDGDTYVGGNATLSDLAPAGDVYVGGNYSNDNAPSGTVYHVGSFSGPGYGTEAHVSSITLPIDFAATETYLTHTSAALSTLINNGSYINTASNDLTFNGTAAGLNIFSIDAATLGAASHVSVDLPAGGYALINVTGSSIALPNVGFAIDSADVLWNLPQATNISLTSFDGSILAPSAAVSFLTGDLNGTLVAKSLDDTTDGGLGELHNVPFKFDITVPLPASAEGGLMLLGGLGIVGIYRRRRLNTR